MMQAASFSKRCKALFVDAIFYFVFFILAGILADLAIPGAWGSPGSGPGGMVQDGPEAAAGALEFIITFTTLVPLVAAFQGLLGLFFGKSPGQWICGVSIRTKDGAPADFKRRLIRHQVTHGWAWMLLIGIGLSAIEQLTDPLGESMLSVMLILLATAGLWLLILVFDFMRTLSSSPSTLAGDLSGTRICMGKAEPSRQPLRAGGPLAA